MIQDLEFTGTQINYYFVCHRKLWLFTKDIRFENDNEYVQLGRLIDEFTYPRKKKQIEIGKIKIDFLEGKTGIIHEVKKSRKIETAHIWQLKYYLYWLHSKGIENITGEIDYPKLKRREAVCLSAEDREQFPLIFEKIAAVLARPQPPDVIHRPFCKKCAYFEFCYV